MTHTTETARAPHSAAHSAAADRAAPAPVRATVNGERRELPAGSTIADLLERHALDPRLVVVEHNREIVRDRAVLGTTVLADGDVVELVHFVGGG